MTAVVAAPHRSEEATLAAIDRVEEQMSLLAANFRASVRDAALVIDPSLQPFGLKLLRLLARCGPLHAGAAADALLVDKSMISRQARLLEDLGLLELQADPDDGRARFLAVTPVAAGKLAEAHANDKVMILNRLSGWSTEDLEQLASLLARLNTA